MDETRTAYVKKNILYSYASTIVTTVFALVSRTVFVYTLGASYLGLSGLFTNVLGILSFSELGIGTAINFSMYKPIAENDQEKIKSLLNLYKKAYRVIALIITIVGVIIFPFLEYLVNTDIPMSEINIYYWIFLFNTVTSYFVSYKTSYVSAIQKNYIVTNTNTIGTIATYALQIIALLLKGDYLVFLLIAAGVGLLQKLGTVIYINHKFPIVTERTEHRLDSETKGEIWKNIKALTVHKLGDVAVNQTDNIIISVLLSTTTVGLMSNYITLNTMITYFTSAIFVGNIASIGNLVAKESLDRQKHVFEVYDFLSFWVYGFVMIAFIVLSQPFITLWLGKELLVDNATMILFFVSKYLEGLCVVTHNFKAAGGRFSEDRWVPFVQAIINLSVSIGAVKLIGLPGVYVGTIAQRLLVNYMRPHIVYKYVLHADEAEYFKRFILRIVLLGGICAILLAISSVLMSEVTVVRFIIMALITGILPNLIIIGLYYKTEVFQDLKYRLKIKRGTH